MKKSIKDIKFDERHYRVIFFTTFVIVTNLLINFIFPLDLDKTDAFYEVSLKLYYAGRSVIRAGFLFIPIVIIHNFAPKKEKNKKTSHNYSDDSSDYSSIRNVLTSLMILKYFNERNKK